MGFLGNTLEEIAGEKAGIIKPDVPVVCYPAQESVRRVFAQKAAEMNAPLVQLDESAILAASGDMYGSTATYQLENTWRDMQISLPGQYQQRNAMTVLALVEVLRKQGYALPEDAVRRGLAETVWPARLEWAGNVLIDGAHNPQGVAALVDYVDANLANKRRVLLSGVLADKLQPEMLGQMVHIASEIVTVTPDTPRAMQAADYAAHLNACGGYAVPASTLAEGLNMALDLAGEDGVVIAAGSLYFAGALRTELNLEWK
jgi:dihydrofolate synthase/folylpolyglutamate synthase